MTGLMPAAQIITVIGSHPDVRRSWCLPGRRVRSACHVAETTPGLASVDGRTCASISPSAAREPRPVDREFLQMVGGHLTAGPPPPPIPPVAGLLAGGHTVASGAYHPAAARVRPLLARHHRWWPGMVGKRFLSVEDAPGARS